MSISYPRCASFFTATCLLLIALIATPEDLYAHSTLIPLTKRRDMVFDHSGKYLYITTSDGLVEPYNLSTGRVEAAYNLGGALNGADIAPDDSFLLVAQNYTAGSVGIIHKLDLRSGIVTNVNYTPVAGEVGAWDVAIGSNGLALVTTQYGGSGDTPLRQIDLATNAITIRTDAPGSGFNGTLSSQAQINRSADGTRFYILEPHISNGPLFTYSASSNTFSRSVETDEFLGDQVSGAAAAVNRNGTLTATRITDNASVDTASGFTFMHNFNGLDSGIAFDAQTDTFYGVNSSSDQIIAYDTNTFAEKFRLDIGEALVGFPQTFGSGTLVASPDGRYLALETDSGVRLFSVAAGTPAPPPTPSLTTRRDVVFDHTGQFAYITTSSGFVERYNLSTKSLQIIRDLGGSLWGADIAADDSFLVVAQGNPGVAQGAFQKLNLMSGEVTNFNYFRTSGERGAWDVAIGSNQVALVTTQGSGWDPVRQIDPTTGNISIRNDAPGSNGSRVTGRTMVQRSADGSCFYFWESNISSGPVFTYYRATDAFGARVETGYFAEYGSAAVSRDGTHLATRIGTNATIDTAPEYRFLRGFNALDGGVAFDAVSDVFYAVNTVAGQIIAFDTNNFAEKFRLNIGESLYSNYTTEFGTGTLVASGDGRYLALTTPSGIRFYTVSSGTPPPTPSPGLTDPRDMVFDHVGKYLFITTSDGFVHPYNLATMQLEAPYNVGGSPNGIDISLDDSFLLIAEGIGGLTQGAFHKLDLRSRVTTDINYDYHFNNRQDVPWDIGISSNGLALVTTGYSIRQIDPATNSISVRADAPSDVYPNTPVGHGAARNRLYFLSDGGRFTYNSATDNLTPQFFSDAYNVSCAINRDGSVAARRAGSSVYLETAPDFNSLHVFAGLDSGIAFDAVKDTLYGVSTSSDQIIAYDTTTFAERFRLSIGEHVPVNPVYVPARFGSGLLVASQDGRYLALQTPTTVRVFAIPASATTAVQLVSVASEKVHGSAGAFDINLPPTGGRGIECRSGGVNGQYTIVFTFANNLAVVGGARCSAGTVSSVKIDNSNARRCLVNLTGVTNAQYVTVTLTNVSDSVQNHSDSVSSPSMGVLVGDTNGDGVVNSGDIAQTKSGSGTTVTASNFREDLNEDGSINSGDIALVKSKSGTALP